MIHYEPSRGHKIDGTKPNQTGNAFGDKQGKQREENGQESSQQKTSSRSRRNRKLKQNHKYKKQTKGNHTKTLLSRLRKRGSPVSGGIEPRHEDKGKDNGCDTQRVRNTEGGKGDNNQTK